MSEQLVEEALNSAEAGRKRTAHMIASVLLDYPPEDFHEQLDVIRLELENVDEAVADRFQEFLDWAQSTELREIEDLYVRTFDQKRKCNLYLSYYSAGDTRMRGSAILAFKQAFEAMGWKVTGGELPDYLPAVLELSARTGDELAAHLLAIHRDGLEVLRTALGSLNSPWLRSVLAFQPQPELIALVPTSFKLHIIAGFLLFAIWPFTRLVHVVSAPVMYPTRSYVVYRSREESIRSTPRPRGWNPVRTRPQSRDSRSEGA